MSFESQAELEPLELVWAKCRGYPSYPALVSNPLLSRSLYTEHTASTQCNQTEKEDFPKPCIMCFFFFSFPFAQLIFPVLIVSEHCRGFIKHWSLSARDRRRSFLSSPVHSAGMGKAISTVGMRRPKFYKGRHQVPLVSNCLHIFLYSEYNSTCRCPTGLVMHIYIQ